MLINAEHKLIGHKCILVPYCSQHVEQYNKWMQDSELLHFTSSEHLTLEQEYEMQRSWQEDNDKLTFIVLHKQNYESTKDEIASMAGDVNAFFIEENDEKCAEISLMIAEKNFRGQGLAQEACLLLMAYVKQSLKLPIFVAKINSDNVASIALFKRIGFEEVKFNKVFESFTFRFDATGFLLYFNLEKYQRMDENGN